jgi:hypothetical protein
LSQTSIGSHSCSLTDWSWSWSMKVIPSTSKSQSHYQDRKWEPFGLDAHHECGGSL